MAQMIPLFLTKEENSSSMVRQRVFRDLNDPLDCYDDLELVRRFRFSRVSISLITKLIAHYLNLIERSYAASPHLQVCVALQFFASGTFQIICGDGINVSQASSSRYIRDVSLGLQAIHHQFVSLPAGLKRVEVKNKFCVIAHFPGTVALVDGTHIRIQTPSENEADYINRHFTTQLTSKIFASQIKCLVMYWNVFLGLFMIHGFGRFQVMGCMLKIPFQ